MGRKYHIFSAVLLMLFSAGNAYPEIFQYFDQEGNYLSSSKIKSAEPVSRVHRYSVPEGVKLYKDITYEYYPVSGKTFLEIVNSTKENGPFNKKENRRFPTKSLWNVGWSYQFVYSSAFDEESNKIHVAVEIYDVNIDYDITITLPTTIDDTSLNPIEKSLWKNYFQKLLEHEHNHVRIIKDDNAKNALIKYFEEIDYLIFDNISNTDIENTVAVYIKEETLKIGRAWVKQLKSRNDEYDRTSYYGKKQELRESFFKKKPSN
jgi:hypothetical protein